MSAKTSFRWEALETLLAEPNIRELLTSYWQELSPIRHIPVDIDWPQLIEWERKGIYRVWAARVDGTLAGFAAFYIQPHVYYRTVPFAVDGGHYLAPAFRDTGERLGARMWWTAKAALKHGGVQVGLLHDNALRPLSPFFLSIGARPFSSMWLLDLTQSE